MAAKKQKKGQLSLKLGINDERVPKLLGLLSLFVSIYLLVAFTSYLFTWQADQDKVLRNTLRNLFRGDLEMANWLGRLGAFVSHSFFYNWFGLPSFILVVLLAMTGRSLVRRHPLQE
ncbi:MAG: DNA translocase FtsK 4TM domain-containing protein, partial [Saprospiraceae bacterium]|nr:DNA translocase FtsK 4TM domain-containing protein [Saprospiraceae bacterium]